MNNGRLSEGQTPDLSEKGLIDQIENFCCTLPNKYGISIMRKFFQKERFV